MSSEEKPVESARERYKRLREAIELRNEKNFFTNMADGWGKRLRAARLAAGLTQPEVAEACDLHVAWVGRAEKEEVVKLPKQEADRLAQLLNFDLDWLLAGVGNAPPRIDQFLEKLADFRPKGKPKKAVPRLVADEYIVNGWSPSADTPSPLPARAYPADIIDQLPQQVRDGLLWAYHRPSEQQLNTEGGDIVLITTHHMSERSGWRFFHDQHTGERWLRWCKLVWFIDGDDGSDGIADVSRAQKTYVAATDVGKTNFEPFDMAQSEAFLLHRQSFEVHLPIREDGWSRTVRVTRSLQETLEQDRRALRTGQ